MTNPPRILALAAVEVVVALAGAVLATPYPLVRSIRRRFAERNESTQASVPMAAAIARTAAATNRVS